MTWSMLSRKLHRLPYAIKKTQVAASQVQTTCGCTSRLTTKQLSPYSFNQFERYHPSFGSRRHYASNVVGADNPGKMLIKLTALVVGLVGCSYAAVPLYQSFCQVTNYGGIPQDPDSVEENDAGHSRDGAVTSREIAVQFKAGVSDGMPWKFVPTQTEVTVKPGESSLAIYTAENQSSTPIVGVPKYTVTPREAAAYFKCVCLEEQRVPPREEVDVPVFFYIDPKIETDPKMDGINNLILSYTFVKVPKK